MSIAKSSVLKKWTSKCGTILLDATTFLVFLFLDFLDAILCVIFKLLDDYFEGKASPCYCENKIISCGDGGRDQFCSDTLYRRDNVFRDMGLFGFARKWEYKKKRDGFDGKRSPVNRWSDCGCESCLSWTNNNHKLHFVVRELPQVSGDDSRKEQPENVIFLHGFLSSSSFWTKSVFNNLCEPIKGGGGYRLFAVDLLGFGKSPKPRESMYTLSEHVEMIEKSVISPYHLNSFHLVAHSMGCIVAVALAAKHSKFVKSVTLVAPPCFLSSAKDGTSTCTSVALKTVAGKRVWPPLAFGKSIMSWYEHVGRLLCFLFCRNHRTWEAILKLFTQRRELSFMMVDLPRHTHHSAWHSMHNVVCGGAKFMDEYLETLNRSRRVKVCIIHGDKDVTVPLECSNNIKMRFPDIVELNIIPNADHGNVIFGRKKDFAAKLQHVWASSHKLM